MRTAEIIPWRGAAPTAKGDRPAPPPLRRSLADIDLHGVARRLGMEGRERRTIIMTVRRLIDRHGFPWPKTPRFLRGQRLFGAGAVTAYSIWSRDAVDQWFDDDLPPAMLAAGDARRRAMTRRALADRAKAIAL
ncbi:hypothetical protein ACMT1E_04425 [Sphingomonas flavalba]|uniref:hypothetical protein n=1 Tax=Sphingomonas flavalba TaxID=2559804 RepID=UPI0039E1F08F